MVTIDKIKRAFGYRLIGNTYMERTVCRTVSLLPTELIKFVTRYCWFISSFEDGWAFVLKASELKKGEFLIFLSDGLLDAGEEQMRSTILHEIGHVVLGHRNSIGKVQTKAEIKRQEREADKFIEEYLVDQT